MSSLPAVHLIIDTNYWIYLAKGEHPNIFDELIKKIDNNEYKLLACSIIVDEWERGISQTEKEVVMQICDQAKKANEISQYLYGEEKRSFKETLDKYRSQEAIRIETAKLKISKIDKLIKEAVKAPITDKVKEITIAHGLEKKAPFGKKNSMADSLIFFSAVEYLKLNKVEGLRTGIFLSYNYEDYSKSKSEKDKIHPDLEPYLEEGSITYERNIGKVLNLAKGLQDDIDEYINHKVLFDVDDYIDNMLDIQAQYQLDISRGK